MANPARELVEVLRPWANAAKAKNLYGLRGGGGRGVNEPFVRSQVHACGLLGRVLEALDSLEASGEDVEHYRIFLGQWWRAVVLPDEMWAAPIPDERSIISVESLAALSGLAGYLDKSQAPAFVPSRSSIERSREALADLLDLLMSDDLVLGVEARAYIFALVDEIRSVFEADAVSVDMHIVRRIHELQGFLSTLADQYEIAHAEHEMVVRIRHIVRKVTPIALPVIGAVGYMVGMTADTLAITEAVSGPGAK